MACKSSKSTKEFFVKKGLLDKYNNIPDFKYSQFISERNHWNRYAKTHFGVEGNLYDVVPRSSTMITITEPGKKSQTVSSNQAAIPNMDMFAKIDLAKGIYNLDEEAAPDNNKALTEVVERFIKATGFDLTAADALEYNASAKVDFLNRVVTLVEGRVNSRILSEEGAHILVAMLRGSDIYNRMMRNITKQPTYQAVLEEYSEVGYTEKQLKEEAIGKMISEELASRDNPIARNWLQRIVDYLRSIFTDKILADIKSAGDMIIQQYVPRTTSPALDSVSMYNLDKATDKSKQENIVKQLQETTSKVLSTSDRYQYIDSNGEKRTISLRVSDLSKELATQLYGISEFKDPYTRDFALTKGTMVHVYNQLIIEELKAGNTKLNQNIIQQGVYEALKDKEPFTNHAEFQTENYFKLNEAQFKVLTQAMTELYNEIIDADADSVILTEQVIYDSARDLAGTVDLLVVDSKGRVKIYDFKTTKLYWDPAMKEYMPIDDRKRQIFEKQIYEYKKILADNYGLDINNDFLHTRIIPFNLQYERNDDGKYSGLRWVEAYTRARPKEYLQQMSVAGEITGDKNIDNQLNKLYNNLNSLRQRLKNTRSKDRKNIQRRIENIQKVIDNILVNRQIDNLLSDIFRIVDEIGDNLEGFTFGKIDSYLNFLELYKDFNIDLAPLIEESTDKKLIQKVKHYNHLLDSTMADLRQRQLELLQENMDKDLTKGGTKKSGLPAAFDGLIDWANPAFQRLGELVGIAEEEVVDIRKQYTKDIEKKTNAYLKWAASKGRSGAEGFQFILTDRKNLISRYDKKFYEDADTYARTIRDSPDSNSSEYKEAIDWFRAHFEFKEDKFKESLERYKDNLEEDPHISEEKKEKQIEWFENMNPETNPAAFANWKNNSFIRSKQFNTKSESSYVADKWDFIYQKGNEAARDYLEMYIGFNRMFSDMVGWDTIGEHFVANIHKDIIDRMSQDGILSIFNLFKGGKRELDRILEIREQDELYGVTDSAGRVSRSIPLLFSDNIKKGLSKSEQKEIEDRLKQVYKEGSIEYSDALKKEVLKKQYEKGIDSKSVDLSASLVLMLESVFLHHFLSNIENEAKALRNVIASGMQSENPTNQFGNTLLNKITGRVMSTAGISSETLTNFDKFMDLHLYGMTTQSQDRKFTIGGKTYSSVKALKSVMNLQSAIFIGVSPVLGLANHINAKVNLKFLGKKGYSVTDETLKQAADDYSSRDPKAAAMLYMFEPTPADVGKDIMYRVSASKAVSWFSVKNLYRMHRGFSIKQTKNEKDFDVEMPSFGNVAIANQLFLAMARNFVIDSDGSIKSLSSAFSYNRPKDANAKTIWEHLVQKDGEWVLEGMDKKQVVAFKRLFKKEFNRITGELSTDQQHLASTNALINATLKFKNWMPGLLKERFGGLREDTFSGEVEAGKFLIAFNEVGFQGRESISRATSVLMELVSMGAYKHEMNRDAARVYLEKFLRKYPDHELGKIPREQAIDDFVEFRRRQLTSFLVEARAVLGLFMLLNIARLLDLDDEEEGLGPFTYTGFQILRRVHNEISFFLNPAAVFYILKDPLPLFRTLKIAGQAMDNAVDEFSEVIGLTQDTKQDTTPWFYYSSRFVPALNQILSLIGYYDHDERTTAIERIIYQAVLK